MTNVTERPVVLITGAARRVGATIARTLHAAGYDLALHCWRSRRELDALVAELERARPRSTLGLQANLADLARMPELVLNTLLHFQRLDGLVNNASAFHPTPIGAITPTQWDELFATNARAPLFLAQAAAPHLAARHGAIVNLIDIYAERPLPRHSVYCMAKAALVMATKALAQELAPAVRVNGVAPGAVLWPEAGKTYADQQELIARTPLKRSGTPDDVAGAVLWLLRDAPFVTGQIIRVDGGRSLAM
ncbi:pteridine reductase [Dokdonella soli]|uniref:Pteridine reductase n=1 Tax=Dokdonella soli TaxID=529810 RepID=A0ABN1IMY5_9GAMM